MTTSVEEEMYGTDFFKFVFDDRKAADKREPLNKKFNDISENFPEIVGQIKNKSTNDTFFYEIGQDHFKNVLIKPSDAKTIAFTNFVGTVGSYIQGGKIYYDPEIYFSCWCWVTGIKIDLK